MIVFANVLLMLAYMACSFVLTKAKITKSEHAKSLSGLLLYVGTPCMIINAFLGMDLTGENIRSCLQFFSFSLRLMLLMFGLLFVIFRKKMRDGRYRLLMAGSMFGNVGFFGLPVVVALFPDQPIVACYSTLFTLSMNMLAYTLGVFLITDDKKYISPKQALLNPTTISLLVAIILYALKVKLPDTVANAVALLGKMTTPLCMFVLGMRLATMNLKEVFMSPFAYMLSGCKLLIFPLLALLVGLRLSSADPAFRSCLVILCATPTGAIVLSLSELHEKEQKLAANAVLLSTLLCLVTMPLVQLLL